MSLHACFVVAVRVGVEQVCEEYEMLKLKIPRGGEETTLVEAIHSYILWEKWYILLKPTGRTSRPSSLQPPPSRTPNMRRPSLPAAPQHSPSSSSPRQLLTFFFSKKKVSCSTVPLNVSDVIADVIAYVAALDDLH